MNMKTKRILLFATILVFCFTVGEIAVRIMGEFDRDGNFYFNSKVILPLKIPVVSAQSKIQSFKSSSSSTFVIDSVLGWVPRPGSRSEDGLYSYNSQGMRSTPREYADTPEPGLFRIAVFGDSFAHCDNVPYESCFTALLEEQLNSAGIECEVLNFGVGGYGLDQAMLRYHEHGAKFSPQLVILGFQPENLKRNLNIVRLLYYPRSGIPFTKPRFIMIDGRLALVNVPVLPIDQIVPILHNFENWELHPYEYFYDSHYYESSIWQHSKLLALIADRLSPGAKEWYKKRILYKTNDEEQRLGWEIFAAFAEEVAANGANFLIVHLPAQQDLEVMRQLGNFPYQSFLDALDEKYDVIHTEQQLLQAVHRTSYADLYAGHFTPMGNSIIADALSEFITPRIGGYKGVTRDVSSQSDE